MRFLTALRLLVLVVSAVGCGQAACITDTLDPGCVHFMMRTDSLFDQYNQPTQSTQASRNFINSHFWRMQTSYGYFDPAGLTWDKNVWAYLNSTSVVVGDAVTSQHPEWVLKQGPEPNGAWSYNGYCSGNPGTSDRYAMDVGDPGYRAWWISQAQGVVARGYKGLWIDDVKMDGPGSSDVNCNYKVPWDDRTGAPMTLQAWEQYVADFMTQVRAALPGVEIQHNSIFYAGAKPDGSDPIVQQEMRAANYVNRERGVSEGMDGTGGPTDPYSLESYLNYCDYAHAQGAYVDIQEFHTNGDYPVAVYYLISSGRDLLGNNDIGRVNGGGDNPGPDGAPQNWPTNYDVKLGNPLGARYVWNNLLRRDFTNGFVLVNRPGWGNNTQAITGNYNDSNGNRVSSVTLLPKQGIVLVNAVPASVSITSSNLPSGQATMAYSGYTFAATGGTPPYTWSYLSGTMPPGLGLSGTGALNGTPTTAGTYSFTVQVTDNVGTTANKVFSVLVNPAPVTLAITTASLVGGTTGTPYSQSLTATGGTPPYIWSIAGNLPVGLSLSGSTISGTPTVAGTSTFTASVTDTVPNSVSKSLSITVGTGAPPLTIQTNALQRGESSVFYSKQLTATGGTGSYTWSLASGALPSGLTLSSQGLFSGTPIVNGTFNFTVQVGDGASTSTQALTFTIVTPPAIVTTNMPSGTVGAAYSLTFVPSGGMAPYTWSVLSGGLPPGLSLNGDTLSGTPTSAGGYVFNIQLMDALGVKAQQSFTVGINSSTAGLIQELQSTAVEGTATTTLLASFSKPNQSAGTIVLDVRCSGSSPPLTVTDQTGNQYSLAVSQVHTNGGNWTQSIYYAPSIAAGPNTVTLTFASANSHPWLAAYEFAGMDPVAPLDQIAVGDSGATTGTAVSTASVTTTTPNELLFSGVGLVSGTATSVLAGPSSTLELQDVGTSRAATITQTVAGVGSYAGAATLSTADYWSMVMATFRTATGSALNITSTIMGDGTTGVGYGQVLTASGGTTPYTWAIVSGALPPGLTLVNGQIVGTPTTAGTYGFTVQVTDSSQTPVSDTQAETIHVVQAGAVTTHSVIGGKAAIGGQAAIQ